MPIIQKNTTNNSLHLGTSWTGGTAPTSLDEGTWIAGSGLAPTLTSNWAVGKLSFGASIGGAVVVGSGSNAQLSIPGLSGTAIDLSGNTANVNVTILGSASTGAVVLGSTNDVALILSPSSTSFLTFNSKITKSLGTVTISGGGSIFFTTDSTATWTGGAIQLDSGTLNIGQGAGSAPTISGVLGVNTIPLKIGTGNPTIITGNPVSSRIINNGLEIGGSFTLGATTGTGYTAINGQVTINPGTHTITVPSGGAGGYLTYQGIQVPFAGSGNIIKAGGGRLDIGFAGGTNTSTWSGTFSANAGTVNFYNTRTLQDAIFDTTGVGSTWTLSAFPASSFIGGLSGNANLALTTAVTLGGNAQNVSATWTGAFTTATLAVTKQRAGTQRLGGGAATTRTAGQTSINAGAIQLDTATGLYASSGSSGTTVVASSGALWLNSVTTNANTGLQISGDGVALNGALRNVGGNSTHSATITLGASSRIYNDIASTTLTLKNIVWGANTLTLDTGATSTATILLDGTTSSSSTNAQMVVTGTGITKAPRATSIPTTNRVTVTVDTNARLQFTSTDAVVATVNTLKSNAGGNARIIIGT